MAILNTNPNLSDSIMFFCKFARKFEYQQVILSLFKFEKNQPKKNRKLITYLKKVLKLQIKKKWFDMICSGEKTEEYREIKTYYKRLLCKGDMLGIPKHYDAVLFINGYRKESPRAMFKCNGITYGKGREEWGYEGNEQVFIIKIGEKI